ncbi:MAG: S8 family serine peptidase [Thermoanaerobaculia bacterium]
MLFAISFAVLTPRVSLAEGTTAPGSDSEKDEFVKKKFFPALEGGIPGSYIVALYTSRVASEAPELVRGVGGTLGYLYTEIFNGFEAELTDDQAEELSENEAVRIVYQDRVQKQTISSSLPHCYEGFAGYTPSFPDLPDTSTLQPLQFLTCSDVTPSGDCVDNWGLDRTDQATLPRDEEFSYRQDGSGVEVFTIDTGIYGAHKEFLDDPSTTVSRVASGIDTSCSGYPTGPNCAQGNITCSTLSNVAGGHGTHVAGIIGGRTFGLAKDVSFTPVKALCPGYGQTALFRAFTYVLEHHLVTDPNTAIVNISGLNGYGEVFGDTPSCSYYSLSCPEGVLYREAMLSLARRDNLLVVQSAGNQSYSRIPYTTTPPHTPPPPTYYGVESACDHSFGDEGRYSASIVSPNTISDRDAIARIIVAGGIDEDDGLWSALATENGYPIGSNNGPCVDVFSPAARLPSSFFRTNSSPIAADKVVCQLSGTSMAAPHVSGVAAMILQTAPTTPSKGLKEMIVRFAQDGVLDSSIGGSSPNRLLHWDPSDIASDGFETSDFANWIVSP